MYTAVLMMALTAGADMPDGRRGGCHGCHGCNGGCYGGCYGGGCYGGGYSYGCCGCCGGGGCYGGGCYGGGCYGGGCYGGGCYGGSSYGGCYGSGIISGGISAGCVGGVGGVSGGYILPSTGTGGEKLQTKPKEKKEDETMAPAPATIVVELPADAKLLIDNEATTSTGSSRVFTSPTLNPGKEYHYTLTAEIVRDGKSVKAEKVVAVKAGATTPVTLTLPGTGVAQR